MHNLLELALAGGSSALHAVDSDAWWVIAREPFVEASKSPALWRALYIPVLSARHVHWAHQVLLSSKTLRSTEEAGEQPHPVMT